MSKLGNVKVRMLIETSIHLRLEDVEIKLSIIDSLTENCLYNVCTFVQLKMYCVVYNILHIPQFHSDYAL